MACKISVAALTGGINVPSARFRVRQLIHPLAQNEVCMHEFIAPISKYPPEKKWLRPMWLVSSITARLPSIAACHRYDITLLQRELISTFKTLENLVGRPRVFDVDDAIFLRRGGRFARRIARQSDLIVCGNEYLADYFSAWNQNVVVLPTAVDTRRYIAKNDNTAAQEKLVIGWIGTSTNIKYLKQVEPVLETVLKKHKDIVFRVICDKRPDFHGVLGEHLDFIPWSSDIETESIQSLSIGIMPLLDTDWERGKCSFKMLQYMACGIPVIEIGRAHV